MPDSSESPVRDPAVPLARAEGAFLALAAGDALGWPREIPQNLRGGQADAPARVEFEEWTRRGGGRFHPYEEVIHSGEYSDDTQLTLAVARSRTNHGPAWWKAFTRMELPLWTLYQRGGGGATKRAAHAWANGSPPWKSSKSEHIRRYFEAGGNGVAMRVLPHALFLAGQDNPATLMHDVVLDGTATHGHPRALVGATAYAYAAWSLARSSGTLRFGELLDTLLDEASAWSEFPSGTRDGGSWFKAADHATAMQYDQSWNRTAREMRELLEAARKGLRAGALADDHSILKDLGCFGRARGAGTSSAAGAAYLAARHAAQPVRGVLGAAFEKGADTDTLAAMTGGLLGCLAGVAWLPQPWLQVQDSAYLRSIAVRVAQGPTGASERSIKPLNTRSILSNLTNLAPNGNRVIELGGATQAVAAAGCNPRPMGNTVMVRAWQLKTSEGQTMYVTKVGKVPKVSRESRTRYVQQTPRSGSESNVHATATTSPAVEPKDAIYAEFCRQLEILLRSTTEMKLREVVTELDLVQSQAKEWLARAEQEERIRKTSRKPVRFGLRGSLL